MDQFVEPGSVPAPDQMQLALERTFLAQERSMMAWIRTAASLITFGLAYFKFFMYLQQQGLPQHHHHHILAPRTFGLLMIGMGLFSLTIATMQHWQHLQILRKQFPAAPRSLSLITAALVSLLGLIAFVDAILP